MDYSIFEGKKILITGATGLIGKKTAETLLRHSGSKPIAVIALVRDIDKARNTFKNLPHDHLKYYVSDVCSLKPEKMDVDYIIHAASPTSSRLFVKEPVETIRSAVCGTEKVLEFARINNVKGLVYLSTMEIYGTPDNDDKIYETSPCYLDSTSIRSCYPESKRLCECLCSSYALEFGVPARIVRLTQTFGPGVPYNDPRVFAEFARCVIEQKDITLKTKGETKRNYLYIDDAVNAILTVLINGKNGEAYNAANELTYCSIFDMAVMVAREFGRGKVHVRIDEPDNIQEFGYAPTLKMNLSSKKLQALGWSATTDLRQAYAKMIEAMLSNIQ